MNPIFALDHVTKRFGKQLALDDVTLAVPHPSIVGLVGKNGSGKTTLIRHVVGLALPSSGTCTTLGCPTPDLGPAEFSRLGVVHQHSKFLAWMKIEQLLQYVSTFYERWDLDLQAELMKVLELDPKAKVGTLSPGSVQKLAMIVATGHRPQLLLLDEPLSDLDPIARHDVLALLLDYFRRDEVTIVVSSHMLHDLETIVDRIVCVDKGRILADATLDDLMERYAEWTVTSVDGSLPERWAESYIHSSDGDRYRAVLVVEEPERYLETFRAIHGSDLDVESRPLNLERIFRVLVGHDIPVRQLGSAREVASR